MWRLNLRVAKVFTTPAVLGVQPPGMEHAIFSAAAIARYGSKVKVKWDPYLGCNCPCKPDYSISLDGQHPDGLSTNTYRPVGDGTSRVHLGPRTFLLRRFNDGMMKIVEA